MDYKSESKELQCRDCGRKFFFTLDEQKFYLEKELQEPKRCYHCRVAAKIARRETMNILKNYGIIRKNNRDM